jgi:hypothetical protein
VAIFFLLNTGTPAYLSGIITFSIAVSVGTKLNDWKTKPSSLDLIDGSLLNPIEATFLSLKNICPNCYGFNCRKAKFAS